MKNISFIPRHYDTSLTLTCPHCRQPNTLALQPFGLNPALRNGVKRARCPQCQEMILYRLVEQRQGVTAEVLTEPTRPI